MIKHSKFLQVSPYLYSCQQDFLQVIPNELTSAAKSFPIQGMEHFGKTLKRLREALEMSQVQLASKVGVSDQTVSDWEQLPVTSMRGWRYVKLAKALGMTPQQLDAEWKDMKIEQSVGDPKRRGIPLINKAPAGTVRDYHECNMADSGNGHWYVLRDGMEDPQAFAVVIVGDSMTPKLMEGVVAVFSPMMDDGKLLFDKRPIPENHVVFVRFSSDSKHEGCTVARWRKKGDKIELVKENKKYKPMVVAPEEIARMAALMRSDEFPGATKMLHANEQLQTKGEMDVQKEGQVFPDYEGPQ